MLYSLVVLFAIVSWLVFAFLQDGASVVAASSATGLAAVFLVWIFFVMKRFDKLTKRLDDTEKKLEEIKELLKSKEE